MFQSCATKDLCDTGPMQQKTYAIKDIILCVVKIAFSAVSMILPVSTLESPYLRLHEQMQSWINSLISNKSFLALF